MGSRRPSGGCHHGAVPELRGTGWRLRESPWAEEAMVKDGMRMRIGTREEGCRGRWGRARACAPPSEFEGHLTVNRTSLAAFRQVSSFKKLMLSNLAVELRKCEPGIRDNIEKEGFLPRDWGLNRNNRHRDAEERGAEEVEWTLFCH